MDGRPVRAAGIPPLVRRPRFRCRATSSPCGAWALAGLALVAFER